MRTRRRLLFDLAAASGCGAVGAAASASGAPVPGPSPTVLAGVDVLAAGGFAQLSGLRVGVVTNQTGRDAAGRRTIDRLWSAPGVRLAAIFSPEHGLNGDREGRIGSASDAATGLPVYSLYGAARRPSAQMLSGLDALVVDLQDVGVRFFTYATTMAYVMEAAAPRGLLVVVLDRPNPIGPAGVRGPVLDPALRSFTGYFPMPVQHAMTMAELARMFEGENRIGARLTVVPMRGYRRDLWFDQTGLAWVDPSPNLRSMGAVILYPGVALVEGTNVSVGRGTPSPFELVGAPWIDGVALAGALAARDIRGARFEPTQFTPDADRYAAALCPGVRIMLTDRTALDAPRLGLELAAALRWLYPQRFDIAGMLGALGSHESLAALQAGTPAEAIAASWRPALRRFEAVRRRYLLYG
ncbi:MAG: DUF1343 domain-containing protein [Caulobacteraceae bacterium]|nr:DUF1343 domain-containing protein [Caulobacteraceae bacterium]